MTNTLAYNTAALFTTIICVIAQVLGGNTINIIGVSNSLERFVIVTFLLTDPIQVSMNRKYPRLNIF